MGGLLQTRVGCERLAILEMSGSGETQDETYNSDDASSESTDSSSPSDLPDIEGGCSIDVGVEFINALARVILANYNGTTAERLNRDFPDLHSRLSDEDVVPPARRIILHILEMTVDTRAEGAGGATLLMRLCTPQGEPLNVRNVERFLGLIGSTYERLSYSTKQHAVDLLT